MPVPKTASSRLQEIIAAPYSLPKWTANHPKTSFDWKTVVDALAAATTKTLSDIRQKLGVSIEPTIIDGVRAFIRTPKEVRPENMDHILLHLHGGGYVYSPGEAGTLEGTLMSAYAGYKVISVDYRMASDFPFPAALDDVTTVYKALLKQHDPRKIAVFGTSTGGGLTLALMLRAKAEGLSMPAAIAPGMRGQMSLRRVVVILCRPSNGSMEIS